VTRTVQRLFGARSAGHLGTLDPFATGLLVVLLGDATRLAPWLERGEKSYAARVVLGVTTDTLDRDGAVVRTRPVPPDAREHLAALLPRFTGVLRQRVPEFSAAKVGGVRRADLARQGVAVEPKFKDVTIVGLSIPGRDLFLAAPREASSVPPPDGRSTVPTIDLRVVCGPGTYVRQLVADLGEELGCGAHTAELRRTRVGTFAVERAVTLETIAANPPEARPSLICGLEGHLPGSTWSPGEAAWSAFERGRAVAWASALDGARSESGDCGPGPAARDGEVSRSRSESAVEGGGDEACFVIMAGRVRGVGVAVGDGRLRPRRVLVHGVPFQAPGGP
jgi:tRNA pseudouridine55 synthase